MKRGTYLYIKLRVSLIMILRSIFLTFQVLEKVETLLRITVKCTLKLLSYNMILKISFKD